MSGNSHFDDDDFAKEASAAGGRSFDEFDCPDCSANNVNVENFSDGDEVRCMYCGNEYVARISAEGKLKFKSA
ncbi:hypothetical protein G4177_30820 [Corallococcus sp. ZKHCc1 1396]|uniref:Uncharacterized protein n=1 Tax=Corallococcus soli TaxID=2710757 RepID=A0ABR9PXF0_9BACT|nr:MULTISPECIES: hypothetical protein [Corallococcus]MBE4752564.1 hypothetical protein [Corallococcus soli]MCY1034393.1 hypothetical protein [Corallococcus sp. BB11-1]